LDALWIYLLIFNLPESGHGLMFRINGRRIYLQESIDEELKKIVQKLLRPARIVDLKSA